MLAQEFDVYRSELCGEAEDWTKLRPTFTFSSIPNHERRTNEDKENSQENKPRHVSAYSIYFRECLPTMKKQYPYANFGEYSRLVAARWETLPRKTKVLYQQKAQHLRKELIRCAAMEAVRKIAIRHPLKPINKSNLS